MSSEVCFILVKYFVLFSVAVDSKRDTMDDEDEPGITRVAETVENGGTLDFDTRFILTRRSKFKYDSDIN